MVVVVVGSSFSVCSYVRVLQGVLDDLAVTNLSDAALEAQTEAILERMITQMVQVASEEADLIGEVRVCACICPLVCGHCMFCFCARVSLCEWLFRHLATTPSPHAAAHARFRWPEYVALHVLVQLHWRHPAAA